ncbi:MAG: type I glyceraldehyde-3-phosphate dehydrogenase, partial [Bacteroidales bacterium]|nr:type I glyceraldehyde-3-phosphate dehydrogenase [Bacteroidales bacterium]
MKKIRLAINGFGRIGRITFRSLISNKNIEVIAINDITDAKTLAHLLKYDSVQGRFPGNVEVNNSHMTVNGKRIKVLSRKDPEKLPWKDLNIDIVIESTGKFISKATANKHIIAGAKRVIISAPAKGESKHIKYIVLGINDHIISEDDLIISNSSCTTN